MSIRAGRTLRLAMLLLAAAPGTALAQQRGVSTPPRASLPNTEVRTLHSNIVGVDYSIYVSLPATYATSPASYPVLFATDGNRSFGTYAQALAMMTAPQPGETPELVIVGIGYPEKETGPLGWLWDWGAGRTRDLTTANVAEQDSFWSRVGSRTLGRPVSVRTGGAPTFLRFIREELIPWVEGNYRVSHTDRALAGYSFGGLFTLYALFQSPETFQRYFAGSPSIEYGDTMLFSLERAATVRRADLNARLFMSAGALEGADMIGPMETMAARLRAHGYPSLRVETHVFEGETHRSCYPAAISRALRVLYAPAGKV